MKIKLIAENTNDRKTYTLPEDSIITVVGRNLGIRAYFHWSASTPKGKPEIDIGGTSVAMFGKEPTIQGVLENDYEEFKHWYKSIK